MAFVVALHVQYNAKLIEMMPYGDKVNHHNEW